MAVGHAFNQFFIQRFYKAHIAHTGVKFFGGLLCIGEQGAEAEERYVFAFAHHAAFTDG